MKIDKLNKAKNSGVYIEFAKEAFDENDLGQLGAALKNPPKIKWSSDTEIERLGLMTWIDKASSPNLVAKIQTLAESEEYRAAAVGVLYLFGADLKDQAIESSEKIFELCESNSNYSHHSINVVSQLIAACVSWPHVESKNMWVAVDKDYLLSTIDSVLEDLRAASSKQLDNSSTIIELAQGYARCGMLARGLQLILVYAQRLTEYCDLQDMIYSLLGEASSIPTVSRSSELSNVQFISREFATTLFEIAKSKATSENEEDLVGLKEYVDAI